MNYDRILIRYGELSTKGRNRKQFVDKLRRTIALALESFPQVRIEAKRERMYVLLNGEKNVKDITKILTNIFGIQSFSPAIKLERDLDKLKEVSLELVSSVFYEGASFKVSARRADKTFELDTNELNHLVGGYLLKNMSTLKVDVKKPDINLQVEVREEAIYLSCENIQGAGGLPSGTSGKAMLMLSGGLDSPVAGYLSMKRGLEVEGVHFFSPPFTSERAKQKVIDLSSKLAQFNGHFVLHIVPFTEIQQLIHKQIPENYTMTATRRMMLRITDELRKRQEALAIITGESLGQVASQTIESMYAINDVTSTPIIRPLVTSDKTEIIEIARQIDTHDISIRPFEDCCTVFVPASPKTKPKKEKVQFYESFVDFEPMIQEAVKKVETMILKGNTDSLEKEIENLF
ncbi:tRNA uracil 4-sulfurtransferase ThiI [Bacillus sp. B1-b2]|uniref:tRNA uracil 4-sulfurtransferase ThiI n=1 Tax=Bacillus sp. B1-b2 TaxID=2653201 RepID=UPI001869BA9C|nr:tRNA uracil 4-sulfurtransferase ThiI [Bacillus sp. B1-b2]